jgi:translation initiation factor 1
VLKSNNDNNDIFSISTSSLDSEINNEIHIRVFQRKTRKYITTIEHLDQDLDFKKILKKMKDKFHCNGSISYQKDTASKEKLIQLSGDKRNDIIEFLVTNNICKKEVIKVHGC